jgi:hypothetical protein
MGPVLRAWRWFLGLRPERLFDVLWFVVSAAMTLVMVGSLGRAAVICGEIPPWLLRHEGTAHVLGSYVIGLIAAAWYFRRMRRLQPIREAVLGTLTLLVFSPGNVAVIVGLLAFLLSREALRRSRLLWDPRFSERAREIVEWRRARTGGYDRDRAGPGDRRWDEPELDRAPDS